jgi:hypothetical protein
MVDIEDHKRDPKFVDNNPGGGSEFGACLGGKGVMDYHDFTWPSMPLDLRLKLKVGPLYLNAIRCTKCDYFVRSRNRHDFRSCKCGSCAVDGGSYMGNRSGNEGDYVDIVIPFENLSENERGHGFI